MKQDDLFLRRAIALAQRNVDSGDGGPFGAVVVHAGKIIGEGWNRVIANNDPTAHAEVMAIRAACAASNAFHLPDAVLYASSEPCPMCLAAAYWARIERIVFANCRDVAAAIGFCDSDLYAELCQPTTGRRLQMTHLPLPGGELPLQQWFANPRHTPY